MESDNLRAALEAAKQRADAATAGPWETDREHSHSFNECCNVVLAGPDDKPKRLLESSNSDLRCIAIDAGENGPVYTDVGTLADFDWIASARTEHPALIECLSESLSYIENGLHSFDCPAAGVGCAVEQPCRCGLRRAQSAVAKLAAKFGVNVGRVFND